MAIKRGPKQANDFNVPAELCEMAESAFTSQQMSDLFKEVFTEDKGNILKFIEHTEEFTLDPSNKTIKIDGCGSITLATRSNVDVDKDKLEELVNSGKINVSTLIQIGSFPAEKLKTVLGDKTLDSISTKRPDTEYLTLKASSEFKEKVRDDFNSEFGLSLKEETKKPAKNKEPKAKAKKATFKRTKKSEAKKPAKENIDDDLAAILGE